MSTDDKKMSLKEVDFDPFADGEMLLTVPTTEPQKEIWLSVQLGGDSANCAYNESVVLSLHGPVDVEALRKTIRAVVNRHEALRGSISSDGNAISIAKEVDLPIEYFDLSTLSAAGREDRFTSLLEEEVTVPFNLARGPLFRAVITKTTDNEFALVFTGHHIVMDGWSSAIIIADIDAAYAAFSQNREWSPSAPVQFSEYVKFIASADQKTVRKNTEQYWVNRFKDSVPVLELPTTFSRPLQRSFDAEAQVLIIENELVTGLKKLGGKAKASLTVTMLAGLKILMHRLSGQTDLVVGIPAAGQSSSNMVQLVGHCVNILPIRSDLRNNQTVTEYIKQLQAIMLDANEYQDFTFGSLLKKLKIERDAGRIPLVSILFNIDPGLGDLTIGGIKASAKTNLRKFENFEWFINGTNVNGEIALECHYNSRLYDHRTMNFRLAEFKAILGEMIRHPDFGIDALNIFPDNERELLIHQWNETSSEYPTNRCVHELIRDQAVLNGNRIAVEFDDESITYKDLDCLSTQLGQHLQSLPGGPNRFVGIYMDRGIEVVVALLGALKSGAAYIPLDPDYPEERLRYMIRDAGIQTILTKGNLKPPCDTEVRLVNMDELRQEHEVSTESKIDKQVSVAGPDDTAYVIYTSGSTGRPKGVAVPHRAFVNFLTSMAKKPGITQNDVLVAVTTLSFDIAGLEIFLPLISGAKVHIVSRETAMDAPLLMAELDSSGATVMQATPSTWRMLLNDGWIGSSRLKVLCGGEPFPRDLVRQLVPKCKEVWNMYGPTETTVWSTCCQISDPEAKILIGRPIANTQCYVLDAKLNPTPIGVPGELYIGGDGLAQGYLGNPDLTAAAFVSSPFHRDTRIYKTGDLVRLQTDGQIEYLNRMDNQVKVRGFRIELGEIESALETHPAVQRAVVKTHDFGMSDNRIIAYYLGSNQHKTTDNELRNHLKASLPEYMIPQYFVTVEGFPLTPAGKVDKKNLPIPDVHLNGNPEEHIAPRSIVEEKVMVIWQNVLKFATPISVVSDFFTLGGHSLLATQTLSAIKKELSCALSLRSFFEHPTIRGLSDLIEKETAGPVTAAFQLAIEKRPNSNTAPLSLQQTRLWYLEKMESNTIDHNLPDMRRIKGPLNIPLFERCICQIFERHEILRTYVKEVGSQGIQTVDTEYRFKLDVLDLNDTPDNEKEQVFRKDMNALVKTAFNLSQLPLMLVKLYILSEDDYVFFFMPHHFVWDGWSFDIFHNELGILYSAGLKGEKPTLPELPVTYGDFAHWQQKWTQSGVLNNHLDFWKQKLGQDLPILDISTDYPRPPILTHNHGATAYFQLSRETTDKLADRLHTSNATLFMTLLSIYYLMLHRTSGGQKDIIVGAPISGRNHDEINSLIGFFVNTLLLRCSIDSEMTFLEFLARVKQTCLESFNYQDTPFERIVEIVNPPRDLSRTPIFQAIFSYQDVRNRKKELAGMSYEQVNLVRPGVQTELEFWVKLSDDGIIGGFDYNCDLFRHETVERMAQLYEEIVRRILDNPNSKLKEISAIPEDQYDLQIRRWNATTMAYPDCCVHELFKKQASISGEKVAIEYKENTITYAALDRESTRLGGYLIGLGVGPGSYVGIYMERGIDMVVALLGVLKSGAAYVPLDPAYPEERLRYMIQDSQVFAVLTKGSIRPPVTDTEVRVIDLETASNSFDGGIPFIPALSPGESAYVIYTSGSTGKPKGVEIPHLAFVNFLASMATTPGLSSTDTLLAVTTLSFDIAGLEIFLPLISGAKVRIVDRETAMDAPLLMNEMKSAQITVMQATPSTWRMLLDAGWTGEPRLKVLCGGESFPRDLARSLVPICKEVWNMYGPTETTVWSTCCRLDDPDAPILIGRPIGNTQCYVLDSEMAPTPIGVPGELYIGGEGLAKGYLNNAELTSSVFVPSPFRENARIYKTGDLVRFQPNGCLEYLNRIDSQVKVRGHRIELGEIESALESHISIERAVAKIHDFGNLDVRIIAYYTANGKADIDPRRHLKAFLPEYMIPQYFIPMDAFLLTPAGKVDKKNLPIPNPDSDIVSETRVEAETDTEKRLLAIWQDVLGKSSAFGVTDSFFQIGGHSLLVMRTIALLRKEFACDLSLRSFFEQPTIRSLATLIDEEKLKSGSVYRQEIKIRDDQRSAPLSLQQQRLWYLDKLDSSTVDLNLPDRHRIRGALDIALLERCLGQIFERHDILRTSLKDVGNKAIQEIEPNFGFVLSVVNFADRPQHEREAACKEDMASHVMSSWDLSRPPLIIIKLYVLDHEDHILFIMPHHIIWDAGSFDVFHSELNVLYTAGIQGELPDLPSLPVQYGDFAAWQSEWVQSGVVETHLEFWKEKLSGELPILQLPTDFQRPPVFTHNRASSVICRVDRILLDTLVNQYRDTDATLFMMLLAAYYLTLYRCTGGQKDLIIGVPISGRNRGELNNLIGFFVNTLVIRCNFDPEMTGEAFIKHIRELCLEAFQYEDTPLERIVQVVNPPRDISRTPIFQTTFAYQDIQNRKKSLAGMSYEKLEFDRAGVQTDIEYWVGVSDKEALIGFSYNSDLFRHETVERMALQYEAILHRMSTSPSAKLIDLSAIPKEEYTLQVRQWNETAMSYAKNSSVHALFKKQVSRVGEKIAAVFGEDSATYLDLDRRSDVLALKLVSEGINPGDLAGIYMERSIDMVVAMLGILKAGAGYVPLDPEYPADRIRYMIDDADLSIIVTQQNLQPPVEEQKRRLLRIEAIAADSDTKVNLSNLPQSLKPENIAYMIYTSGSTGTPKGVRVPHRALTNFLTSMQKCPGISENDVLLAVTTLSFDIAELELLLPLVTGAKVVISDRDTAWDALALIQKIQNMGITIMQATPSTWRMLTSTGWEGDKGLKILCGGEAFPIDLAKTLVDKCGELWNMYGPTETTVWSTCYQIRDKESPILIGRPIGNTQVFVLDEHKMPTPIGVPGELYIGGDGLTQGYHNKPELTKSAFVENPFMDDFPNALIYKTGDLCRFLPDGNLEYLQRIDTQVKIRGHRIELGEIESRLESHEAVKQAVAILKEAAAGDVRLAAFVIPKTGNDVTGTELRRHLRKYLPDYMIPQYFTVEETPLPLTPAGKIDRKLLAKQFVIAGTEREKIIEPSTDSEQYLGGVWREILQADSISTHHNFFNIGGHSLLAMQVIARIYQDTGIQLTPRELLLSTLEQLAAHHQFANLPKVPEGPQSTGLLKNLKNKIRNFTQK